MKTLIKDIKKVVKSNEFKNDEIQIEQLLLDFIKKDRAKQFILSGVSQQREQLKKWWKYFDEESVAVNCTEQEREEVINDFFNCC